MYKYCVAQVNVFEGVPEVTFYAYQNNNYGTYRTDDWDDPNVIWYDSRQKARDARMNDNDCVLYRYFEKEEKK